MIGPEPISRIEEMSSRRGIAGEYGARGGRQVGKPSLRATAPWRSSSIQSDDFNIVLALTPDSREPAALGAWRTPAPDCALRKGTQYTEEVEKHLAKLTLVCAALVPTMALGGSQLSDGATPDRASSVQLEADAVSLTSDDAPMGCTINVKATNKGRRKTAISRDSQVKTRNGIWKKLGKSVWISPGQTASWTYKLDFGCNNDRIYRFLVKQFDSSNNLLGERWHYHEGRFKYNGKWRYRFIRDVSFDLGDLNRFF